MVDLNSIFGVSPICIISSTILSGIFVGIFGPKNFGLLSNNPVMNVLARRELLFFIEL